MGLPPALARKPRDGGNRHAPAQKHRHGQRLPEPELHSGLFRTARPGNADKSLHTQRRVRQRIPEHQGLSACGTHTRIPERIPGRIPCPVLLCLCRHTSGRIPGQGHFSGVIPGIRPSFLRPTPDPSGNGRQQPILRPSGRLSFPASHRSPCRLRNSKLSRGIPRRHSPIFRKSCPRQPAQHLCGYKFRLPEIRFALGLTPRPGVISCSGAQAPPLLSRALRPARLSRPRPVPSPRPPSRTRIFSRAHFSPASPQKQESAAAFRSSLAGPASPVRAPAVSHSAAPHAVCSPTPPAAAGNPRTPARLCSCRFLRLRSRTSLPLTAEESPHASTSLPALQSPALRPVPSPLPPSRTFSPRPSSVAPSPAVFSLRPRTALRFPVFASCLFAAPSEQTNPAPSLTERHLSFRILPSRNTVPFFFSPRSGFLLPCFQVKDRVAIPVALSGREVRP